jgi:hypothetical protein
VRDYPRVPFDASEYEHRVRTGRASSHVVGDSSEDEYVALQQFHALMHQHGWLDIPAADLRDIASARRAAMS